MEATAQREESLRIAATDGVELAATLFEPPAAEDRKAVVQIHPATAVQRGIYVKYARFLASRGFTVLTFDYRGTGESLPGSLRSFQGRMRYWGERDIEGVLRHVAEHFPRHRHLCVAHSVGGQVLGLAESVGRLEAVWAVATQWGSWRLWPAPRRYAIKALAHVLAPGLTAIYGYFPGRLFGMGDLPKEIGLDWMRWCRSEAYIEDDAGRPLRPFNDHLRARVRWNGFADDHFLGPRRAIAHMATIYPRASSEVVIIDPREVGATAIGHFGFFRSPLENTLWRLSADWLAAS